MKKIRKIVNDPLKPSPTLLVKLGSIAVHADEMNSYGFNPAQHAFFHDRAALTGLLMDPEIDEWIMAMNERAMLPGKR